jgi:hypothetical protein
VVERRRRIPINRRMESLSEVAQIKQQIELEYLAAKMGAIGIS